MFTTSMADFTSLRETASTEKRPFDDDLRNAGDYAVSIPLAKPAMPLSPESKYPSRRAYVLKVRGDATGDALAGRLENLVTGGQCEFTSGRELLDSIASDLASAERGPHPEPARNL
jgi:hypothetical protein